MPRQASRIPPTRRVPQGPRLGPQGPPPTPRARASSMLASGIRVVARVGVPQDHVRPFFDNPPGRAGPQDRGGDQTPLPWDGVSGTPLPWGTLGGPGGVPWGTLGGYPPTLVRDPPTLGYPGGTLGGTPPTLVRDPPTLGDPGGVPWGTLGGTLGVPYPGPPYPGGPWGGPYPGPPYPGVPWGGPDTPFWDPPGTPPGGVSEKCTFGPEMACLGGTPLFS